MLYIILVFICILYVILIICFYLGFDKVPNFEEKSSSTKTKFSIVIPFRNEVLNLPPLLDSISLFHYDNNMYEFIFVDDNSTDNSVKKIEQCINNSNKDIRIIKNDRTTSSPKKDAITSAIKIAKYDWIITTDADCILPKFWLDTFNCYIQKNNPKMIVAPVAYYNSIESFLKRFQVLDFLSLMGATIGGFGINKPFLCNGANLAYTKELFINVNGFNGNTNIASGDDIFLMEKALQTDKNAIHYLKAKSSIVLTQPQPSWRLLISQRKRWAAKTSNYNSVFGKLVGLIVLFMNASIVISLFLAVLNIINWPLFIFIFILKLLSDFALLYKTSRFFNQEKYLYSFFASALIYPLFSVYIAFISMFTSYKWKDRRFNK
ncbi:glycosyltransferase [uncultured Lacinutrix sp.]|uniref:glycosyltransferase n=1 Tax=uncultured Lacinutrix sp. TaxID=574032 RepID=UPI00260250F9|nr:glycosyltransferase [uncultured Lacinutrix sp.]